MKDKAFSQPIHPCLTSYLHPLTPKVSPIRAAFIKMLLLPLKKVKDVGEDEKD
jgi:hypothetical protein